MADEAVTRELRALSIYDPDYLLFSPPGDKVWLRKKFHDIPRYLFRVSTPKSDGTTNNEWAKSKDARYAKPTGKADVLSRRDDREVAGMLDKHLRWRPQSLDNFVSWTSSLLFALQYAIYRNKYSWDLSRLSEIDLCIIDTTEFPPGVFLRDVDLIFIYQSINRSLQSFGDLRKGRYYFGEYLSQGALRIENKCQIVSAQAIFDRNLFVLQPEFEISMNNGLGRWAKEVLRLREPFYNHSSFARPVSNQEVQAAIRLAQLFGPRWRLPVAANLMALSPHRRLGLALRQAFKESRFTDAEREECSPCKTKVISYHNMPEVQQFRKIMVTVYLDSRVAKLKDDFKTFEAHLREAIIDVRKTCLDLQRLTENSERCLTMQKTNNNSL